MRALLSFFTALPVRDGTLQEAARAAHLLPLIGVITGLPGAALLLSGVLPPGVAATLALIAALLAAGLHHADAVLDVGDALMVRGALARRRAVLKDGRVGVGAFGAVFAVYGPALASLAALAHYSAPVAALSLLAAEVSARSAMLLALAFGEPAESGSSALPFVRALKGWRRISGAILALLVPLLLLAPLGAVALAAFLLIPIVALAALRISDRAFGGIGGDLAGATGEACRAAVLVFLSATM